MAEEHQRPNPDELLARIQAEEQQQARGKLKIFLGYAAGVGKTYAMLEAAHQRKAEGVDVVAAYVETHGRAETEVWLEDLEVIPRKQVEYRGILLPEMDVDAVLARRPQLALIDELAHTNAPGSRHPKRYQDVEELLAAGIDVYTTLNIQHLESLNDVVAQITGITIRETILDRVIDEAAEIELIDLPPDELLQRLKEGKVYVPEQAAHAIQKFFRKGNLTALREIAMRRAAERVDEQMRAYMQTRAIPGPWPARERLLVCIGSSPLSERLVRTGRRLADELDAEWFAVYVETPAGAQLSQTQRDQISRLLLLAEELGGKAVTLPGRSIAETVVGYARKHNVTKIIVGKPLRPHWYELLRGSPVDQIIRESRHIDVYIISEEAEHARLAEPTAWRPHRPWRRYGQGLALVAAGTLLNELVCPYISTTDLVMIYLLVVVIAALYLGRGPSILASILSVLAFDLFFVPPHLTLAVSNTRYFLTFLGLLLVGLTISNLAAQVREQVEAAQHREADTAALYALSRDLAVAIGLEDITRAIIANISQTFGREAIVFLPNPEAAGTLKPYIQNPGSAPDEHEMALAAWVFQHGQSAGRGTDTLPAAEARYMPLKSARGVVGVLGVRPRDPGLYLTPEQRRLLEACASLSAVAIERAQLAEAARNAQLLEVTEKLHAALLNSISHDLRTPLVAITGALSSLADEKTCMDDATRRSLVETAWEEADRLNRLVGNLLDMTRIEAGAMKAERELCDVQDVIGAALERLDSRLGSHQITVNVPADLPLVPMDFVLIVHVLVNVIDNALRYSPVGSPVEIRARAAGDRVEIEVSDRGIGIPPEDLMRVFDKFYRVQRPDNVAGTGLGLSISKGIVEVHGGTIWAQNRPGGGTVITLALPLGEPGPNLVGES
jgi:two-component system sensor histidine kinase KdpD